MINKNCYKKKRVCLGTYILMIQMKLMTLVNDIRKK